MLQTTCFYHVLIKTYELSNLIVKTAAATRIYTDTYINEILDVVLESDGSDIVLEGESYSDSDWEYESEVEEHFETPS